VADEAGAAHAQVHHQAGWDTDCEGMNKPRSAGLIEWR
jgi:hypothetical protein